MNNLKYSNGSATYVESLEKKIAELEKQIVAIDMNNEPVAWINRKGKDGGYDYLEWDKDDEAEINTPLYAHPAKELTDEEIKFIAYPFESVYTTYDKQTDTDTVHARFDQLGFARAILRKAREK